MIALLSQAGLALASLAAAQPAPPPLRAAHYLKRTWADVVQEVESDEIIAPRDEPRTRRKCGGSSGVSAESEKARFRAPR